MSDAGAPACAIGQGATGPEVARVGQFGYCNAADQGWHDEGREYPGVNDDKPHSRRTPRVWLLLGHKAGDNNQVLALAEALGWPWEEKRIVYRPWELLSNRLLGITLCGIDRGASSALEPPWPDLVITSGRRNEPVARWIRRQAPGVRLVHVGRPWAPLDIFDLIVTTPQYSLPERANVLENELPMHRLRHERLEAEARRWRPRLAALAAPRIAVLLGGNSGAFVFTPAKARRLGRLVNGLARSQQGSVLVTDSARTPPGVTEAFLAAIDVAVHCHRWGGPREDNPYLGYLGLADQFVVTADSMSMIAEALYAAKPLFLFSLDDGPDWWKRRYNYGFKALTHRLAMAIGPHRMRRDTGRMIGRLVAQGRASWLGEGAPAANARGTTDEARRAALAVAALFTRNGD